MVEAEDRHAEKRAGILAESLAASNAPSWGYFGASGPLAIGDNSYAPKLVRPPPKEDDGVPTGNVTTRPLKKGAGPDVYFQFETPLALDNPYIDPHRINAKGKITMLDPDAVFRPPGTAKQSINKLGSMGGVGFEYKPHLDTVKDPKEVREKYRDYQPPKNILTNAAKKGGGGILTGGVLFGYPTGPAGEKTDFPEHMSDFYDAPKQLRQKELEEHRAKLQEQSFKGNSYGNQHFADNGATFSYESAGATHIPRDKVPVDTSRRCAHESNFRPSNPSKRGAFHGTIGEYPEYLPDPVPGGASRKPPPEGDPAPSFKLGALRSVTNPMPSVVCNVRNMRNERPASFARPVL